MVARQLYTRYQRLIDIVSEVKHILSMDQLNLIIGQKACKCVNYGRGLTLINCTLLP